MNDYMNLVVVPILGVLIWLVKYITSQHNKALEGLKQSLNRLSDNVAYCPYRTEIEKRIKGDKKSPFCS